MPASHEFTEWWRYPKQERNDKRKSKQSEMTKNEFRKMNRRKDYK